MSQSAATEPRVIVALDYPTAEQAIALVERLRPDLCRLKVGKELFTRAGPALVDRLVKEGFDVFLDLKFHDIPNTVARACAAAADLGVWMMNVHALGGRRMMEAAREALGSGPQRPLLIGVTVLTSLGAEDLAEIGLAGTPQSNVQRLAALTHGAGLDGVVCSPREAQVLREAEGDAFVLVTPGVRPTGVATDDQRRVMTPTDAVAAGAHYLVMGRPVTQADDPVGVLLTTNSEIGALR
ncbi:MAG: orotidine-5'-phosphate decarboxylase [Gammaproteobacteria bacterium]|jgi:orotidine-5'-phosphate decarboxylase